MKKKILLGLGAAGTALALLPLFAAFEAHVINVTAKIENALSVNTESIDFGTVFPQEHLNKPLVVQLSQSFIDEDRVDDVEYFIRQKPKCGVTTDNGTVLVGPTATGHVSLGADDVIVIDCGAPPRQLATGETWGVLPSLCEYISKESEDANDGDTPSFHHPWTFEGRQLVWNDTLGRLAKSDNDTVDNWVIDLAVPCFGGFCAQDWESFVDEINPNANPDEFTQPIGNQHKIFGCDLWVEVSGVSRGNQTLTVVKIVDNTGGGQLTAADFDFQVDGGAATPFEADNQNDISISAGSHTVVEVPEINYITTYSNSLNGNADCNNLNVPLNGSVTCTITNTFNT